MVGLTKTVLLYASITMVPPTTVHAPFYPHVNDNNMVQIQQPFETSEERKALLHTLVEIENKFFVKGSQKDETMPGILILDASRKTSKTKTKKKTQRRK